MNAGFAIGPRGASDAFDLVLGHGESDGTAVFNRHIFKVDLKSCVMCAGAGIKMDQYFFCLTVVLVNCEEPDATTLPVLDDLILLFAGDTTHLEAFRECLAGLAVSVDHGVGLGFVFAEDGDVDGVLADEELLLDLGDLDDAIL